MKFRAEDLHHTYCKYFHTNLFRWNIFDSTNIHRTAIYRETFSIDVSCIMITYPISSNMCKKIYLQCYQLYNFSSFGSRHWRSSVRKGVLRNIAKFTGKTCGKVSLLIKLQAEATASDLSSVFSWRYLVYFIWKKGNTLMELKYLLSFCSSTDLLDVNDFKRNLTDGNLIRKCV